jgi:hypothetical protein
MFSEPFRANNQAAAITELKQAIIPLLDTTLTAHSHLHRHEHLLHHSLVE